MGKQPSATLPENLPSFWQEKAEVADLPITTGLLDLIGRDESLCQLVREALENNPDLKATALRLQAEGYLLSEPRSQMLPKIDAGFAVRRNNQESNYETYETETATTYKPSASISWELDLWGRLADQYQGAKSAYAAKEQDYLQARDALAARVIQGWVKQLAARRAVAIEEERLQVLTRIEEILIQRYRDGIGTLDDYSTAASRTQIAKADLSLQRTELIQSVRALEIVLGRYPEGKLSSDLDWPELSLPQVNAPTSVLAQRPDIRAGLARVDAARNQARGADKARLPSTTLSGEVFRSGSTLSDIGSATTYWGLLGSLFQPIFEGGKLRDEARAQHSEADATVQDLRVIVLRALSEVENTLTLERELAVQAAALKIAEEESKKSSLYFTDRYRQGLDNIQSLLIAREQEISTRIRLNQAQADRLSNRIDLAIALGVPVTAPEKEQQPTALHN
ncbi:TolC family protein [Desulfogranum japonicum]|uniref:TolC family protein n=1 Tax=Desulfogranum japonicum TaxID=231447 RepID=UPI001377CD10|nr:TolC family protein [Desulfogranum japonicum]